MPRMLLDLPEPRPAAAGFRRSIRNANRSSDTHKQNGTVIEAFRLSHQASTTAS